MSKMSREEKLFRRENEILMKYKEMASRENSPEETSKALEKLTAKYSDLLLQTRFMTWVSGRLERKLQRTNRELINNNKTLQHTLDELTKSEASRSAYAIIYFIAIVLFVLEEFLVEPLITELGGNVGYGILIKLAIVLFLKLTESAIERKITMNRKLLMRKNRQAQARAQA
jgi:hypothetical protein